MEQAGRIAGYWVSGNTGPQRYRMLRTTDLA